MRTKTTAASRATPVTEDELRRALEAAGSSNIEAIVDAAKECGTHVDVGGRLLKLVEEGAGVPSEPSSWWG